MSQSEAFKADYEQTIAYFKELHETRFRLIALLPIATGAAIILLPSGEKRYHQVALSFLGLLVTLGLILYDQRNTQIYDRLQRRAKFLERSLGFPPLQVPPSDTRRQCGGAITDRPARRKLWGFPIIWHDLGLSIIYAAALGGWVFLALDGMLGKGSGGALPMVPLLVGGTTFLALLLLARANDKDNDEIDKWIDLCPVGTLPTRQDVLNPCYEVEIRGRLSHKARKHLERNLAERGATLKSDYERESYIFERDGGCLDLRIRDVETGPELLLKFGLEPHAIARWKHALPLGPGVRVSDALDLISYYGFKEALIVKRRYKTYLYRGYKIVLAQVPKSEEFDYFEIEGTTEHAARVDSMTDDLHQLARDLQLEVFSKEDYRTYLQSLEAADVDEKYRFNQKRKAFVGQPAPAPDG